MSEPRTTIIVPTAGRAQALAATLQSLLAIGPPPDVEILVVDNNTEPALHAAVRAACNAAGPRVRHVLEPAPGQTAARHRGAREARGALLIYIDDDVTVSEGWLGALLGAFDDASIGLAGGPSVPAFTGSVPAWFWEFLQPTPYGGWSCGWVSLLDIGRTVEDIDPIWIWGLNLAIRRELLLSLGGFHPDLVPAPMQRWQGDGETGLALKAKGAGVRAAYRQDALLQHRIEPQRLTGEAFARRGFYQGVCDSFTSIRGGAAPSAMAEGPKRLPEPGGHATEWARQAHSARVAALTGYNEGWRFHQREAASDPQLLAWIRRPDYWDADLRSEAAVDA